jgi:hypothetical protein
MASRMRRLMRQKLQLEARTGETLGGSATYAAAVDIKARLSEDETVVTNEKGEQKVCKTIIYTEASIKNGDRLTFTGGTGIVFHVVPRRDRLGNIDHMEAYLK